jgi:hypothetical protein
MPSHASGPFPLTAQPVRPQPRHTIHTSFTHPSTTHGRRILPPPAAARGGGGDDMEVAVFRFTLGIPGFDDALIPRVVGFIGAAALLANHLASPQPVSDAQARVEALGAVLAAVAVAAPSVQTRLEELRPGRGRRAAAESVPGGASAFGISETLPVVARRDLAWASYALLNNANICGLVVVSMGQAVACRGILGEGVAAGGGGAEAVLTRASEAWANGGAGGRPGSEPLLLEDRGAVARAGLDRCGLVPSGAGALAVVPLRPLPGQDGDVAAQTSSSGVLMLICDRERALSAKEVRWAQGVAALLAASLPT